MISLDRYSKYHNLNNTETVTVSAANIDDIFRHLKRLGIEEIKVNEEQMGLISVFVAANFSIDYIYERLEVLEIDEDKRNKIINEDLVRRLDAFQKGKVNKFMGIKLWLK